MEETEQKLGKLVDNYLDGTIEKATYLQKKEELIKIKTDLYQKKSVLGHKGVTWNEPQTWGIETYLGRGREHLKFSIPWPKILQPSLPMEK